MQQAMHPELNYSGYFRKKWVCSFQNKLYLPGLKCTCNMLLLYVIYHSVNSLITLSKTITYIYLFNFNTIYYIRKLAQICTAFHVDVMEARAV